MTIISDEDAIMTYCVWHIVYKHCTCKHDAHVCMVVQCNWLFTGLVLFVVPVGTSWVECGNNEQVTREVGSRSNWNQLSLLCLVRSSSIARFTYMCAWIHHIHSILFFSHSCLNKTSLLMCHFAFVITREALLPRDIHVHKLWLSPTCTSRLSCKCRNLAINVGVESQIYEAQLKTLVDCVGEVRYLYSWENGTCSSLQF